MDLLNGVFASKETYILPGVGGDQHRAKTKVKIEFWGICQGKKQHVAQTCRKMQKAQHPNMFCACFRGQLGHRRDHKLHVISINIVFCGLHRYF